jgi:Uma2 family endonuclease
MSAVRETGLSFDRYLELERSSDIRHEFHDGLLIPVAGMTEAHNLIVLNVSAAIQRELRGSDCIALTSGMRVWIPSQGRGLYPDASIVCGAREYHDTERDTLLNPIVLVEVSSKSTDDYDHGAKFRYYRSIPSFREYLLISQHERLLERYLKQSETHWSYELFPAKEGTIAFSSLSCVLSLDEIYERVALE